MLTVERPSDAPVSTLRRLWALPLWAHALAAAVLLALLIPVIGLDGSFSADEGAALAQAERLADGDGWIFPHPFPAVDPELDAFPLHNSEYGERGIASYAKHPAYPLLLAAAMAVGGLTAVFLLSIAGTVVAALLSAALAGRLDRSLVRPAFWVGAVVSPLFFDGFVVMAHSLAAAAAAGAALLAVRALRGGTVRDAAGAAACVVAMVLLRTEGVFFGAAIVAAAGAWGLARRTRLPFLLAAAVGVATAGALFFDRLWWRAIVGMPGEYPATLDRTDSSFVVGRLRGFVYTWIQPSDNRAMGVGPLLLLVAVAVLVAGTIAVRRRPAERGAVTAFGLTACGLTVAAAALTVPMGIPGLVVAFPLLFVGLTLVDREVLRAPEARLLLAVFALFSLAVLATQYEEGGSAEWGGRYFALGLPVALPVALDALRRHGARLHPVDRRAGLAVLAVVSCVLSGVAVASLRYVHSRTDRIVERVSATAGDIVVTTVPALPRLAWTELDERPWLLVAQGDRLPFYLDRLHDEGVERVIFATRSFDAEAPLLDGYAIESIDDRAGFGWRVVVVRLDR